MGLFENENPSKDGILKECNVYLDKPSKGLALIRKIFSTVKENSDAKRRQMCQIIEERLIPLLSEANINSELDMLYSLNRICDALHRPTSLKVIDGKSLVGLGGRFSAGKSCFINSLVSGEERFLPEDTNPSTSITTYIVKGNKRENIAISALGQDIFLDDEAIEALAHKFYKMYKIGFSQYIKSIVLRTPCWEYENIALVDTPGYNKFDGAKKQELSDLAKAREQLKNVDNIIWLVDCEKGTIENEDIRFLEEVAPKSKVLIVVNKADKKPLSEVREIVSGIKMVINTIGIKCYDVVAYDSLSSTEILSDDVICGFLTRINQRKDSANISTICEMIKGQLEEQNQSQLQFSKKLLNEVYRNTDLLNSVSLVNAFRKSNVKICKLTRQISDINSIIEQIGKLEQAL